VQYVVDMPMSQFVEQSKDWLLDQLSVRGQEISEDASKEELWAALLTADRDLSKLVQLAAENEQDLALRSAVAELSAEMAGIAANQGPVAEAELLKPHQEQTGSQTTETKKGTLYDRLGGDSGLKAVLDTFFNKVFADKELASFFAADKQEGKQPTCMQKDFLAQLFGSPKAHYEGRNIIEAHLPLMKDNGMNMTHFGMMETHFVEALHDVDAPEDTIEGVKGVIESVRPMFEDGLKQAFELKAEERKSEDMSTST
jgi:hemoglobin